MRVSPCNGSVAQLVERTTENREVTGSTPVGATRRWFIVTEKARSFARSIIFGEVVNLISYLDRIAVDPNICFGKPRIRGTRMTVKVLLELLAAGETTDEILSDYPYITAEDISAVLAYAAATLGGAKVDLLVA